MRIRRVGRLAALGTLGTLLALATATLAREARESDRVAAPGPYPVGEQAIELVDRSRPTAANGDYEGAPDRTLEGAVWYPAAPRRFEWLVPGPPPVAAHGAPFPLVIYSHGFMSWYSEGEYLAEYLASHGYILVAVSYPLSHYGAPGGPVVEDVVHQPADVSFLIDAFLGYAADRTHPFAKRIDERRIAAMGLSLGGMTTTLAAFHAKLRDPRLSAAVSIAGPMSMFTEKFFATSDVPYLVIAGDIDAMILYEDNAAHLRARSPRSTLVTLAGASHTGFSNIAATLLRWFDNPDSIGCDQLTENLPGDDVSFEILGGEEVGVTIDPNLTLPCPDPELPDAISPSRQHELTTLAAGSFLESRFAPDPARRHAMDDFIGGAFARENPEVRVDRPDRFNPSDAHR